MSKLLGVVSVLLLLSGCQTVESVSISQIPVSSQRTRQVESSASSPIIIGIPFGSSFVNKARALLLEKCPYGKIEGLLSKHQTTNYFLSLFIVESVELEGYCIQQSRRG